ncbi:PadR family transcriptional regulator [Anaerolineales bacterium HSG6]|nr:PadR family transcriptional regulator [Anaerolineales bacterium HSG6]
MPQNTKRNLTIEYALLGFLRERPMHGYEIHQKMMQPTGLSLVWHLKQSQLYALLGKMERWGYLSKKTEQRPSHPPRKVFELTALGQEQFLNWLENPVEHARELRIDFLAKLYFAQREDTSILQRLIDRQRQTCRTWLQSSQPRLFDDETTYEVLVHQFRVGQIEAMLTWLDFCEEKLEVSS